MLGEDEISSIIERTLAMVPSDHAEVFLYASHSALTRFANNGIHQNVAEQNTTLTVRAVEGKKVGIAETNDLREESLKRVALRAAEIAHSLPENPEFRELVRPTAIPDCPPAYFAGTANCPPRERAAMVKVITDRAIRSNLTAAGNFATAEIELGIVNTMGVAMYQALSDAQLQAVVMDETGSGYTEAVARDMGEIDAAALAEEAAQKCLDSRNPRDIEPGTYPVLLEEHAVGTLMAFLSYIGFNARAYQEGRSCLNGKLHQQVASPSITLWDDGLDARSLPVAFDYEGTAKEKVMFIDKGVAVGLAHDSFTANKEGIMSTGHALPASQQNWGALPQHLFLEPGAATVDGMIASMERGLYVTRFHYTNVVEEPDSIITGMTRDGTWWVENGKLAYPVKNLRFTQGILQALQGVRQISQRTRRLRDGYVVPLLLLDKFHFSSKTTF